MDSRLSRRDFVRTGGAMAAGVAASLAARRAVGANERIRVAFIGVANRGGQLIERTLTQPDVDVVALCDVHQAPMRSWAAKLENKVDQYEDYRRILERDDVDAVFIATPDHWHALQTIDACQAGKDVFVEKPASITIHEGRRMVEVARSTNRVVQVGIHRRTCHLFMQAREYLSREPLGKICVGRCARLSNMYPNGIGREPDCDPPEGLNWDLWLGPRPYRPFNPGIAPYNFRWHKEFSSQLANWGVHYFDAFRMVLNEGVPTSICAIGGQYVVNDTRDIPDTMEVIYEFPAGRLVTFSQYESSGNPNTRLGAMVELRGTQGTMFLNERGYEVLPERGGQFQSSEPRMEPVKVEGSEGDVTTQHIRNFLDCVKSREQPTCDIEEGHRSTTMALLAQISLEVRARIEWDPVREQITNLPAANDLLHYEYRAPWKLA